MDVFVSKIAPDAEEGEWEPLIEEEERRRLCPAAVLFAGGGDGGSKLATLRTLRDEFLATNPLGRRLISFYYEASPSLTRLIQDSTLIRNSLRIILIPFLWLAELLLILGPTHSLYTMLLVLGAMFIYLRKRRVLTHS
jgi:hypothetical protein